MSNERTTPEHIDIEDGGGCAEAWEAMSDVLHDEDEDEDE